MWPLRAYLDAIKRAKPAICRLLQEVRCAALLLHETVWRVFAYLKACAQFLLEPRGHVEPPDDEFFHKPAKGYVENKARPAENILRIAELRLCQCVLVDARLPS